MFSKLFFLLFSLFWADYSYPASPPNLCLTDQTMRHIINTLPKMIPQLQEIGINVSQAYYIWPRDAALHAKGEVILEDFGYDALQLNALETFCKAWFCLNYDTLAHQRQKIITTTGEQITENPYITDEQKRINIRILNKELGQSREELDRLIGEENLRQVRVYRDKIKKIWGKVNEEPN